MSKSNTVADIMNPKLLYVRAGDRVALARKHIIDFGVTAVPVLDETHRPVGIVSLRDLLSDNADSFEATQVVATVKSTEAVDVAAKQLAESGYHHLVVIDEKGVAVGMVSALDFVRAFVNLPPHHPEPFQRFK